MQCRAPSSSTTCSGTQTQTGQQLTWDVEGRLANWQNAPSSPTPTAKYLYDGEGNRVIQRTPSLSPIPLLYFRPIVALSPPWYNSHRELVYIVH